MRSTNPFTLLVALAAAGLCGLALLRPAPPALDDRLDALEERLAQVEQHLAEALRETEPSLRGRSADPTLPGGAVPPVLPVPLGAEPPLPAPTEAPAPAEATAGQPAEPAVHTPGALRELVDQAVERKAAEMQRMRDKRPPADSFARVLELSELQRRAAEQEIVRGQRDIKVLLETPTADGTVFLDELVDALAHGMARPGEDPERGKRLLARLTTETVPGTDQTYAARAEETKQAIRDAFKRDWTPRQYARFEAWKLDPTQVRDIAGSPWTEIEARVRERAAQLRAEQR